MEEQKIDVSELNKAIMGQLEEYKASITESVKKVVKDAMRELVRETKATAPKRTGTYRSQITSKVVEEDADGIAKLWYVKGDGYRLSHLLNNGHVLRNGGRYAGTNFIGNAVEKLIPKYVAKIREVLKRD